MSILAPFLALLLAILVAAYHRLSLAVFTAISATLLVAVGLAGANLSATIVAAVLLALGTLPLLITPLRQKLITTPLLKFYTRILPPLSDTERTALEAGTVGFEGELFSQVGPAAGPAQAGAYRRGAGVPGRPGGRSLPHDQRLGDHPRPCRPDA